ncbi:MAG TPA: polyprenyl diphosphate synthase [Armatimonadota bacterium]|nr:polyprenyl diphosphate synthase [Armatimonadota bacterium]
MLNPHCGIWYEVDNVNIPKFSRLPRHIVLIPDGNRRWAQQHGLPKEAGYAAGLAPVEQFCDICLALGIEEMTAYGFTMDNTKRPSEQRVAFQRACVRAVEILHSRDVAILVVGNDESPMFPRELLPYRTRQNNEQGKLRGNLLVNYDWNWDLRQAMRDEATRKRSRKDFLRTIGSADVSRIDLVIRWGGRRRLSGLLPVQSVYADFYVIDDYWPDFQPEQFFEALRWYETQDVTLGG